MAHGIQLDYDYTDKNVQNIDRIYRYAVVKKMENLVRDMQSIERGIEFRAQKQFMATIPSAFAGSDIVQWLKINLVIMENIEAIHLGNMICGYGYFYSIADAKSHTAKNDNTSLYRFQAPYYWVSRLSRPDAMEYAIFLLKRAMRGRGKHGLEEYELETLKELKVVLCQQWEFILMQAEELIKAHRERKKADRYVLDCQERAMWRVVHPPPNRMNRIEEGLPRHFQLSQIRSRLAARQVKRQKVVEMGGSKHEGPTIAATGQVLSAAAGSKTIDNIIMFYSNLVAFDWFVQRSETASNHWLLPPIEANFPTDDGHIQSIKQVRMWATSFHFLIKDPVAVRQFDQFLEREFSAENLHFWFRVNAYKSVPLSQMPIDALSIFEEYLGEDATSEINIDAKILEDTIEGVQTPDRFTFEEAHEHIYTLMKTDSYVRFLRSDDYTQCLEEAQERQANPVAYKKKVEAREKAAAKAVRHKEKELAAKLAAEKAAAEKAAEEAAALAQAQAEAEAAEKAAAAIAAAAAAEKAMLAELMMTNPENLDEEEAEEEGEAEAIPAGFGGGAPEDEEEEGEPIPSEIAPWADPDA